VSDRESISSSDSDDSELHDGNLYEEGGSVDVHQRSGMKIEQNDKKGDKVDEGELREEF
jgi:hypothetical protein